jgi:hypothetical protein
MPRVAHLVLGVALAAVTANARAEPGDAGVEATDAGAGSLASPGPTMRTDVLRPTAASAPVRACSFRHPLCVHAAEGTTSAEVLATLASAERAWDTAIGALDLPPPDADPGTGAYDVYMVPRPPLDGRTMLSERDVRSVVDRASAFTVLDARLTGCTRDRVVARELLRAVVVHLAPAMDEGSARAQASAMADLVAPCAAVDTSLFEGHPERALVDTWPEAPPGVGARFGDGAGLAYGWLDATFAAEPGGVVRALWALSPTVTPLGAWRWNNEPDTFDVLRASFKDAVSTGSTIDDLLRELSVARAVRGDAKVDWAIDWPDKPRRLSSPQYGVAPSGTSIVALRRPDAGGAARTALRLELEWETHAKMRFAIVKLDAAGRELGHLPIPTTDKATAAQMSVVDLGAVATVLVVATNCGDAAYPFDPDDEAWEPHGYLLTVAPE